MKLSTGLIAVALGAAAVFAAEPAADPLSAIQRPRGTDPEARLSPSTQFTTISRLLEKPISDAIEFLDLWQSPNGSWDRLENRDPILSPDPNSPPPVTKIGQLSLGWQSGPYDGPVKDLAENEVEHVADTCISGHAMLHAVVNGRQPELSKKCRKSIEYICGQIDKWNGDTIYIQKRIFDPLHDPTPDIWGGGAAASHEGLYYDVTVDTFFALRFLAYAKSQTEEPVLLAKIDKALAILVAKIEKQQHSSGTWLDETDPVLNLEYGPCFATHCAALRAINFATRQGIPVKDKVRQAAEDYFTRTSPLAYDGGDSTPRIGHRDTNKRRAINFDPNIVLAATQYDIYRTKQFLLTQAKAKQAAGTRVDLAPLQRDVDTHRAKAVTLLKKMVEVRVLACRGPALEACPDLLEAVWELAPADAANFERRIINWLLDRQESDGHFIAGYGIWGRGDNTFGTGTSLLVLMQIADHEKSPKVPAKAP